MGIFPLVHSFSWDHPRIRGTNSPAIAFVLCFMGSSPHTRDKLSGLASTGANQRIIPAYAGQIGVLRSITRGRTDHPRIRGTNVDAGMDLTVEEGSSPHTRDKYYENPSEYQPSRIIPAYAGQISSFLDGRVLIWDHPRIRGTN